MGTRALIHFDDGQRSHTLWRQVGGDPRRVLRDVLEIVEYWDAPLSANRIATELMKVNAVQNIDQIFSGLNSKVEDEYGLARDTPYRLVDGEDDIRPARAYCKYEFHSGEDDEEWRVRVGYEHPQEGTVWKSDLPLRESCEEHEDEGHIDDVIED